MYALYRHAPDLWRITLPKPELSTLPAARPNHVYLLTGSAPALINAGHPSQFQPLCQALRQAGVSPGHIERILVTSWSPDALGGVVNFPRADAFVLSPDMVRPIHYERWLAERRRDVRELAEGLQEHEGWGEADWSGLDAYLQTSYPTMTGELRFVPTRAGHVIRAADHALEVIETPGPDRGHVCLYEQETGWLFSGDLTLSGLPDVVEDVSAYLLSMDRAQALAPAELLPNYGLIQPNGAFTMRHGNRFLNNFLSNASAGLHQAPTLVEFVERDLGFRPSDALRFVGTLQVYRAFLDELVRSRKIEAQGTGLARRYGTDIDDSRASVRPSYELSRDRT